MSSAYTGQRVHMMVYDELSTGDFIAETLPDALVYYTDGVLKLRVKRVLVAGAALLQIKCLRNSTLPVAVTSHVIAQVRVPTNMPRLEQWRALQSLVDLVAARHGVECRVANNKLRRTL